MTWLGSRIMAIPGVVGCHIGESDTVTTSIATLERQGRAVAEPTGMIVVTLEASMGAGFATEHLQAGLPSSLARGVAIFSRELVMP